MRFRIHLPLVVLGSLAFGCHAARAAAPNTPQSSEPEVVTQARAMLLAGKAAEAESSLRSYLAAHADAAKAHFLLGNVLFLEQKPKESLREYTAGARTQRPSPNDLEIVSFDYVLLGDWADADKWMSLVVRETPLDARAWYLLGRTKYNENRFAEAIDCFTHALQLTPRDVKAENNLGLAYEGLNKNSQAEKAYETAIQWQQDAPIRSDQPYLNLGTLLMEEVHTRQALPLLQQAVALSPKNPKAHEQLAHAYQNLKMLPQAEQELKKAVELAPKASALHFKLGQIYQKLGMKPEAIAEFAICKKLDSTHSSVETPNIEPR